MYISFVLLIYYILIHKNFAHNIDVKLLAKVTKFFLGAVFVFKL